MISCFNAPTEHISHIYMYWWYVTGNKNEGMQLGLAFIERAGGGEPFFYTLYTVHFASMIDNT